MTRGQAVEDRDETLFAYLARELARLHTASPQLPFDLNGGFVGYLGYELKADCGAADAHRAELPDAFLLLADRIVAIDHEQQRTHLLALSPAGGESKNEAERWIEDSAAQLDALTPLGDPATTGREHPPAAYQLSRQRAHHLANIEACKRLLERGRELRDLPHQPHLARDPHPTRSSSTASCAASTRRPTAPTCGCARARC